MKEMFNEKVETIVESLIQRSENALQARSYQVSDCRFDCASIFLLADSCTSKVLGEGTCRATLVVAQIINLIEVSTFSAAMESDLLREHSFVSCHYRDTAHRPTCRSSRASRRSRKLVQYRQHRYHQHW